MQPAPAIDLSAIPAAQRAAVLALMETVAALTEITRRQEHLIAELNHALHGKRSEKLTEDERQPLTPTRILDGSVMIVTPVVRGAALNPLRVPKGLLSLGCLI